MLNAEKFTKWEEMKERIKFEETLTTQRSRLLKFINIVVLNNDDKWYLNMFLVKLKYSLILLFMYIYEIDLTLNMISS